MRVHRRLVQSRPVTHGAVPRGGVRFVRDEKMALCGSASVISMGDSPKVPFFQDVLEFGTRRQLELFTIIGKIAIIQDVLELGTPWYTYSYMYRYSTGTAVHVFYCTTRVGSYSCTPAVHTRYRGVLQSHSMVPRYWCTVLYGRYSSCSLYQVLSAWGGLRYLYWNSHTRC